MQNLEEASKAITAIALEAMKTLERLYLASNVSNGGTNESTNVDNMKPLETLETLEPATTTKVFETVDDLRYNKPKTLEKPLEKTEDKVETVRISVFGDRPAKYVDELNDCL